MFNVHFAEQFRKELSLPITTVGSIMTLENAEMILSNGWADFVAMARPILADPELVRKSAWGHEDDVIPCIRCNYHGRVTRGKGIACAVNPLCGREMQFQRNSTCADQEESRYCRGGPPMRQRRTARERGHEVVLFERGTASRSFDSGECFGLPERCTQIHELGHSPNRESGAKSY